MSHRPLCPICRKRCAVIRPAGFTKYEWVCRRCGVAFNHQYGIHPVFYILLYAAVAAATIYLLSDR